MPTSTPTAPVYHVGTVAQLLCTQYSNNERAAFSDTQPGTFPQGFMTFFDPGWSIIRLRNHVTVKHVLYSQEWYDDQPFATLAEPPRYRQLQMEAVKDSFGKTFPEQQALVPADMEIPRARVVVMGMVIHFLATGERLFSDCCVRCVDHAAGSNRVSVGDFDPEGVDVSLWFPGDSDELLGLASSRKF